jgi:hypothetical protein
LALAHVTLTDVQRSYPVKFVTVNGELLAAPQLATRAGESAWRVHAVHASGGCW